MKKFNWLSAASLFLFAIIVNSNCGQKDSALETLNKPESQQTATKKPLTRVDDPNSISYDQIRLFSQTSQKLVFNKMNSSNKGRIWLERISYAASLYRNSVKKEKILELKTFISSELYSNKLQINTLERSINIWINDNTELLGYNNLRLILTTLSELSFTSESTEEFSEITYMVNPCPPCDTGDPNACTCSTSSDWCSGSNICGTGYGCNVTSSGCGTFWAYSCNGKCGMW